MLLILRRRLSLWMAVLSLLAAGDRLSAQSPTTKLPFTDFIPNAARTEAGRWQILNTDGTVAVTVQGPPTPGSTAYLTGSLAANASLFVTNAGFSSTRGVLSSSGLLLYNNSGGLAVALNRLGRSLELYENPVNGTKFVEQKAAESTTSSYTVFWPPAQGTGVLTNDGSGNLSWAAGGGALPVADTAIITQGSDDATKQFRLENDTNIPTGTTVVGTIPSSNFTFAGLELEQTFTARQTVFVNASFLNPLVLRNSSSSGLVGTGMINNSGVAKASVSWHNADNMLRLTTFESDRIQFTTNSTDRAFFDNGGLRPNNADTLDIGSSSLYWKTAWTLRTYAEEFKVAATGTAMTGFGVSWTIASISGSANYLIIRDNAADPYVYMTTAGVFGGGRRSTIWTADLNPNSDLTYDLGSSDRRWRKLWAQDIDISGSCTGCGGSPPFIDSTPIIRGSGDATKQLAFEVDGFTSGTTRTLTPQDASYTIAGINIAQTFTATQTFQLIRPSTADTYDVGTTALYWKNYYGMNVYAETFKVVPTFGASFGFTTAWTISSAAGIANNFYIIDQAGGNYLVLTGSGMLGGGRRQAYMYGDINPDAASTRNLGASGLEWDQLWVNTINLTNPLTGYVRTAGTYAMAGNYTITQNLYLRTYAGGDANCSGVADGWVGFRTDTNELQICSGGITRKVTLT